MKFPIQSTPVARHISSSRLNASGLGPSSIQCDLCHLACQAIGDPFAKGACHIACDQAVC